MDAIVGSNWCEFHLFMGRESE